ncbi:hypothetical protein V8C35DRAFT_329790 [Trichoderma chlorosporum]
MAEIIKMNLQPAPHPVINAAGFPRVHAESFPLGDRATFAKYYPYGLPVTYKMMHGVHSKGVAQTYLEDNLPVGFYTNVPPKARAFISTSNGSRPFRKLDHILPQRRLHLWSRDEIQATCNSLRKVYWNELKHMQQPHCWDDLWTFFDAHDLYHNGCMNLWNVVNTLWDENKLIAVDVRREIAAHIGHWADEWLKQKQNQDKLIKWQESHGPIFRILDDQDHKSLGLIHDDVVPLIASALKGRRSFLLSHKEREQAEEPADLMTACRTNSIENWLIGQRVFDNNGLPPPPVSEAHRSSSALHEPAPCVVENGKHYFLPQHCLLLQRPPSKPVQALEALQKSANAPVPSRQPELTKSGVVIVNGSNRSKQLQGNIDKANKKKGSDIHSQSDPRRIASMPETSSPVPVGPGRHAQRDEMLAAAGNEAATVTEARRSSESTFLSACSKNPPDHSLSSKEAGGESMTDKLTREVAELERANSSQDIASIDQPIPSEREGHLPPYEAARLDQYHAQRGNEPFKDSATTRHFYSSQDVRMLIQDERNPFGNSTDDFTRQHFAAPMRVSPDPTPFYMQPEKVFMPQPASANEFPHQTSHLSSAPSRAAPHSTAYREFSGAPQSMPLQDLTSRTHPGTIPAPRLRNTTSNGSDVNTQAAQQTRPEPFHGSSNPSLHHGSRDGSLIYNKVDQRRHPSHGQKAQGWDSSQQAQLEHHAASREPYLNKSWRRSDQPDRIRRSSRCLNPMGPKQAEYTPCSCSGCNERNRSIWVRICTETVQPNMDIQASLKFGVGSRFGPVDECYPAPSTSQDVFIVRFVKESSVPQALAFGSGKIAEKGLQVIIRPVFRSKWMNIHRQQQPWRPPSLPIAHQRPIWTSSASSGAKVDYVNTAAPTPSSSVIPIHTPEQGQFGISSRHNGTEVLPYAITSNQGMAKEMISPAVELAGIPDTDGSKKVTEFIHDHEPATSVEDEKNHEPEKAIPRATTSVQTKKTKKKEITSLPKRLPEDTVGKKDNSCDKSTRGREDNERSSPNKARVALPSSHMTPDGATEEACKADSSTALCSETSNDNPSPKKALTPEKKASSSSSPGVNGAAMRDDSSVEKKKPSVSIDTEGSRHSASEMASDLPTPKKGSENAWNRIPMPLDPQKSKKIGIPVIPGQPPKPQFQKEPSVNAEQVEAESSELSDVSKTRFSQPTERVEESAKAVGDAVQRRVTDKGSRYEEKLTNEENVSPPKTKSSEPLPRISEQSVEDKVMTAEMTQPPHDHKANAATNSQGKLKGKSNKNKKAKKRLASALQAELEKGAGSQEVSPPNLQISATLEKGKSQMDHDAPRILAATGSPPHSSLCPPENIDEISIEQFKDSSEQTVTGNRTQYPYDTLPRGRLDFRSNAGGSLKVPKKRKNKYPTITSKTFEASASSKFAPPQAGYSAGSPTPTPDTEGGSIANSVMHAGEPDPSKKSRLNPLATSFVSPRKATAPAVDSEAAQYSPRAAFPRATSREINVEKMQSPSKFKIMRRPATAQDSPSKASQLREKCGEGLKGADSLEYSIGQQENSHAEAQRGWSKDRYQRERENIKMVNSNIAPSLKDGGESNVDLDKQDWPELPMSRVRSATLQ